MKVYGEAVFDVCYLVIALVVGIYILVKSKNRLGRLMGIAILVLGCGDAFHLVPRVLNNFVDSNFTSALGIGKLITSITMTIFYIFIYYIYKEHYSKESNKKLECFIWALAIFRIILCLLPQNRWMTNDGSVTIGIIRNIPFVMLGLLIVVLFYKGRKVDNIFKNMWLYITFSFLFYIPVVVGAQFIPALGMFMLPKTICYILIIFSFKKYIKNLVKSEMEYQ